MVLVDTSLWVAHLRQGHSGLESLLNAATVVCHPFIIGELACGNLKQRLHILSLLRSLPGAVEAKNEEVMDLIERHGLMGKGLGFIDMHLLASAMLTNIPLWTLDRSLNQAASMVGIAFRAR
jgi:predicted nucleic acid-binding protein